MNEQLVLPLQRLTRAEKNAEDFKWYKKTCDYFIQNNVLNNRQEVRLSNQKELSREEEIANLIGLYNNDVPADWFKHMTEPITGEKGFMPAKIRPLNIIKPNIDYLISTYGKRPLQYFVNNSEQGAYNEYLEQKKQYKDQVIQQRYIQTLKNGEQQDTTPEKLIDEFGLNYKDALSAKAQSYIDEAMTKYDLPEKWNELFVDYSVQGEPVSYRGIKNGKLEYRRVDRANFAWGKSTQSDYVEDGSFAIEFRRLTLNEAADELYSKIKESDWKKFDENLRFTPTNVKNALQGSNGGQRHIEVYHVYWHSLKKQGTLYTVDEYGQPQKIQVDEEYVSQEGEEIEWSWIPQIYHVDRWGKDFYTGIGELPYAVSQANGLNSSKLPYNGISFGYKTDKVFSPLKMGVPYLVLYLIGNYTIEKLMAKHKGKVLLIHIDNIPKTNGWNEKKFMKYLEGMGYMFVNPSQIGGDKSFNQYNSIDMSTLGDVNALIQLCDYYKGQWDDLIGIPRQMRGQTYASDQVGNTKAAIVQSGVTIDYIFQKFERYIKRELQYILELTKFLTLDGYQTILDKDEYGTELLNIAPGELFANLNIKVLNAGQELDDLNVVKEWSKQVNQTDPLTIVSIATSRNIAQLKKVLNKVQRNQQKQQEAAQQQEQAANLELEQVKEDLLRLENDLKTNYMQSEYVEKRELEYVKGEIAMATMPVDTDGDGVKDNRIIDVDQLIDKSRDRLSKERMHLQDLNFKNKQLATQYQMNKENNQTALQNKVVGERNKAKNKSK